MQRRQEFQSIKTHEFVFQDSSGVYPNIDTVLAVATDKGIARFTDSLNIKRIYAETAAFDNIQIGTKSASFVTLDASQASFHVMAVDTSATFLGNIVYNNDVLAGNVDATENYMVAVGPVSNGISSIRTSVNGIYWQNANGQTFGVAGNGAAWNGCLWVAVGQNTSAGDSNTVAYSANGVNWTFGIGGFTLYGKSVAWNGTLWIAVGTDGVFGGYNKTVITSTDGIHWSPVPTQNMFQMNYPQIGFGSHVAWNGEYWVAVGYDYVSPGKTIYVSKNGYVWIVATCDSTFTPGCRYVAWGDTKWVAVGDDRSRAQPLNIKYGVESTDPSIDTIVFTSTTQQIATATMVGNGVAWNGSMWILVANTGIFYAYSNPTTYSGTIWTQVPGMTGVWNGIVWNGSSWIAVGQSGIRTSQDGLQWDTTIGIGGSTHGICARKLLPNAGYILPKNIPASRNTVDASGMDIVFVPDTSVLKHSVILLTVRIPTSKGNIPSGGAPGIAYNQGRAYVYQKIVESGFFLTSYQYDYSTYDYAILN
jgi:hypothetical protein